MKISINYTTQILNNKGLTIDFKTHKPTNKKGFCISIKDTETQIQHASNYTPEELTKIINKILLKNTYNETLNKNKYLGFYIDEHDTLYIDISKILNVSKKDIYKVKNEAFTNNQYSVYNNITNTTYKLIIPIYTIYNTSDLLHTIELNDITSYSQDFYNWNDLKQELNLSTNGSLKDIIFDSVEDIPEDYNYTKVIIKDTSNYTRDILEYDINITITQAQKLSRLIESDN